MSLKNRNAVDRITVLWAITECGLGGFFHALQSPFTGLLVGGLSVTYISLIAWHGSKESKTPINIARLIIKAAITVIVAKAIISPHSPVGAYLAVSIQAILGIFFFSIIPSYNLAALALGTIATAMSAIQKILVLWIVFGQSFFDAIDDFTVSTAERFTDTPLAFSISYISAIAYVSIYTLGGLGIGFMITRIPQLLSKHKKTLTTIVTSFSADQEINMHPKGKAKWTLLTFLGLFALTLIFQFFIVSPNAAILQLLRTLVILAIWFLFLQPLVKWLIQRYAQKNQMVSTEFLSLIRSEIPVYLSLAKHAWLNSKNGKSNRVIMLILILLHYTLDER